MAKKRASTTPSKKKRAKDSEQLSLGFGKARPPARRKATAKAPQPTPRKRAPKKAATAESMAASQREISVSEFFAKNRHLLGFDNKRKALLTAVKEAVDNSLDACEEAHILPEIHVTLKQTAEDRFRITVRDNGPGIVKAQIPNIFGKLLYGSKFHRLRMSRGQQGIGISAAGMYGLLTTGKPIQITSRVTRKPAHHYQLQIDTKKNRPEVVKDETVDVEWSHGTEVTIDMVASYVKGKQSVDEYVFQTAIANPHTTLHYKSPIDKCVEYERSVETLPDLPAEIKPHPHGVELGMMIKMVDDSASKQLGGFLQSEFSRVSTGISSKVCKAAKLTPRTYLKSLDGSSIERIYDALQGTRIMAPPTNCLAPIGPEQILAGLLQGVKAEFYSASSRPPSVYRGNPFQIEVGIAYGGDLGPDAMSNGKDSPGSARVIRFANRVPLLYQQSACCTFKAVIDTKWNNYGLSQARGALPAAPLLIMVHMASVWVPFTSESKEAIADYDEIRKEIRLGIQECGRRLGTLLRRKKKKQAYARRRDVFTRYIDEVVNASNAIKAIDRSDFKSDLQSLAQRFTEAADMEFDDHGRVTKTAAERELENTVVVPQDGGPNDPETLFENTTTPRRAKRSKVRKKRARK
jgi:DNA topoisomerase-6 subunit B